MAPSKSNIYTNFTKKVSTLTGFRLYLWECGAVIREHSIRAVTSRSCAVIDIFSSYDLHDAYLTKIKRYTNNI
jgi:hypothetical protein